ncbi:MAG: hypothetical protein Q9197_005677, partial [Variospora fuerteventurae]
MSMIGRAWNRTYSNPTLHGRKREFDDEGLGNSSDTPLFSSDDHPASAEDYFAHHNKRQRRGPWWGHKEQSDPPLPRTKVKRGFKRNMDSGVWMGSDSSVDDDLDILAMSRTPTAESLHEIALRTPEEPIRFDGPVFPYWDEQPIDTKHFWCIQKAAAMRIEECIDDGEDTIDLSNFGLTKLQGSTIEPLHYFFTKHRISQDIQGKFEPFGRDLMVFLANNMLAQVPPRLLRLENLTVLSLRGNKLTELPSAIGNLVHLREFNVSQNNLRWLPYEIRDLLKGQLKLFGFQPNPFLHPLQRYSADCWQQEHPFCSTKPALLHIDGTLTPHSPPSPVKTSHYSPGVSEFSPSEQDRPKQPRHAPSLFETCLRNLSNSLQLSQLPFLIPPDAPESLVPAVKHTWRVKEAGGQRCTMCRKSYMMPRAEWIEWWQLAAVGREETHFFMPTEPLNNGMLVGWPVPLLRRGCSWACVPTQPAANYTGWGSCRGCEGSWQNNPCDVGNKL